MFGAADLKGKQFVADTLHACLMNNLHLFEFLSSCKRGLSLMFHLERPLIKGQQLAFGEKGVWA